MSIRQTLDDLGIILPALAGPFGAYVPARREGNFVFVSGQLPMKEGKLLAVGQVPSRCTVEQAKKAAEQCVINALAAVATLGPDAIANLTGVLRVGAFVSSDSSFTAQPQIANGASELLLKIFGDAGKHVRAAVGTNTLPLDAAVEIEFVFVTK